MALNRHPEIRALLGVLSALFLATGLACVGDDDDDDDDVSTSYQWYTHPCGNFDPVELECGGEADYLWLQPSVDLCEDLGVSSGDPCSGEDGSTMLCVDTRAYTCASIPEQGQSSEAFMTCRNEPYDPSVADGCPVSSRSAKRNIRYIEPVERTQLAREVLDVKLARYNYRDITKPGLKLGYILEDQPAASFSGDGHVDLYAYVSAVVALAQEQQNEINRLKAEVEALKGGR